MTKTTEKRTHADFQSRYRRSSNFRSNSTKNKLVLNGKGELVLKRITEEE